MSNDPNSLPLWREKEIEAKSNRSIAAQCVLLFLGLHFCGRLVEEAKQLEKEANTLRAEEALPAVPECTFSTAQMCVFMRMRTSMVLLRICPYMAHVLVSSFSCLIRVIKCPFQVMTMWSLFQTSPSLLFQRFHLHLLQHACRNHAHLTKVQLRSRKGMTYEDMALRGLGSLPLTRTGQCPLRRCVSP